MQAVETLTKQLKTVTERLRAARDEARARVERVVDLRKVTPAELKSALHDAAEHFAGHFRPVAPVAAAETTGPGATPASP